MPLRPKVNIMPKSLNHLRKKIKPEVQLAARPKAIDIVAKMSLVESKKACAHAQATVPKRLTIAQPNISQIEPCPDLLISIRSQYVEALGCKLELRATFPDGQDVEIKLYS